MQTPDLSLHLSLPTEEATARLAARLAALAQKGDSLALFGDLGAGKTSFARAFIGARLGAATEVPSPTFTLLQTYEDTKLTLWHFDFYRLKDVSELTELGFAESVNGIGLIEWPERIGGHLPASALRLHFAWGDTETARRVLLEIPVAWQARLKGFADA